MKKRDCEIEMSEIGERIGVRRKVETVLETVRERSSNGSEGERKR